jgi:predicted permease
MRFPWQKADDDLQRELAHHLAELTDEFIRRGHSPAEAAVLAKKQFGGPDQIGEQCRDESRWAWLQSLTQDVAFGWRMMWKTPAVTIAAVLSLALGIGANTAIVSLMHTVLWRSLPVPQPEQLSLVMWTAKSRENGLYRSSSGSMFPAPNGGLIADFFSYRGYQSMRRQLADTATLGAYSHAHDVSVAFEGRPTVAKQRPVDAGFVQALKLRAVEGRVLSPQDDNLASPATVLLGYRFWRSFLNEDPSVIGKPIRINNRPHLIVGVLDPSFYGLLPGDGADFYTPIFHSALVEDDRRAGFDGLGNDQLWATQVLARRQPDVTPADFQSKAQVAFRASWSRAPKSEAVAPVIQIQDGSAGLGSLRRNFGQPLLILAGLVGLLLAIACANIANLLLARANARQKEVALRISLGCARSRLVRQFLTESGLLAILGGIASIFVAYAASNVLATFMADRRSRAAFEIGIDLPMVLAALGFSLLTVLLFGLYPALRSASIDTSAALKEGAGSLGASARHWWTPGKVLIVGQMALSIVLVAAAALFVRNLQSIQNLDPGYDRTNLLVFGLRPGTSGYTQDKLPVFWEGVERAIATTPGVASAGLATVRPMDGGGWWDDLKVPGRPENYPSALNMITPGYLSTQTPKVIQGRNFTREDIATNSKVLIISEDLARKIDPANSVLGRKLHFAENDKEHYEIVGIAPSLAYGNLTYRPHVAWRPIDLKRSDEAQILVRTVISPAAILPAIRETIRRIDPNLPLVDPITIEGQIAKGLQRERMFATLCSAFGILALILSAVGLYGVMSYNANRRRNEIGVRLALGARPGDVVRMVVQEGLLLTTLGLALGAPAIYYGAQYIQKIDKEWKTIDAPVLAVALSALAVTAAIAAWLPARRASRLDPMSALRQD